MTFKDCIKCEIKKPLSSFHKNKDSTDGRRSSCKKCCNKSNIEYSRTKLGLVTKIYSTQRSSSKRRGHCAPLYTLKELVEWVFKQPNFDCLFKLWVECDYESDSKPSIDRKNDYIGYSLDNIQLITWKENKDKYRSDVKSGVNRKHMKPVIQFSLGGVFVKSHYSISSASRLTNISLNSISACINNKRKSAGSFKWELGRAV